MRTTPLQRSEYFLRTRWGVAKFIRHRLVDIGVGILLPNIHFKKGPYNERSTSPGILHGSPRLGGPKVEMLHAVRANSPMRSRLIWWLSGPKEIICKYSNIQLSKRWCILNSTFNRGDGTESHVLLNFAIAWERASNFVITATYLQYPVIWHYSMLHDS